VQNDLRPRLLDSGRQGAEIANVANPVSTCIPESEQVEHAWISRRVQRKAVNFGA
jgi:hypothetical protein